jgi:hypothetical protein
MRIKVLILFFCAFIGTSILFSGCEGSDVSRSDTGQLALNDSGYFETRGLNIMVFSNWYDGLFDDAKISGWVQAISIL